MSDEPKTCPKCGADFSIDPTSEEVRKLYGDRPPASRLIVIYDPYEDFGTRYRCPDCRYEWEWLMIPESVRKPSRKT